MKSCLSTLFDRASELKLGLNPPLPSYQAVPSKFGVRSGGGAHREQIILALLDGSAAVMARNVRRLRMATDNERPRCGVARPRRLEPKKLFCRIYEPVHLLKI
jgi:hypothetical protein